MGSLRATIALLGLLLLAPTIGWTHAVLVKSSPARRATRLRAPARVQLWFNERLEPAFSALAAVDATAQQVDLKDVRVGPDDPSAPVLVPPAPLSGDLRGALPGLSVDGHIVESESPPGKP
jgi:methionine-rich copper-binding protein CopC